VWGGGGNDVAAVIGTSRAAEVMSVDTLGVLRLPFVEVALLA
jgi:hypothetical protein